jgi:hypothetical protein
MTSKNLFNWSLRVAIGIMLATVLQITVQAGNGDDPPKIDTRPLKTVVRDSLFKLGCKGFLGRDDDFICTTKTGETFCEAFKKAGEVKDCKRSEAGPKRIAPPFDQIVSNGLAELGCSHFLGRPDEYLCKNREASVACDAFLKNGDVKDCKTAKPTAPKPDTTSEKADQGVPKIETRSQQTLVSDSLFKLGCKRFLGRESEYLCSTRTGEVACEAFKNSGEAKDCKWSEAGPKRIAPPVGQSVRDGLFKLGCKSFLGREDDFLCSTREGEITCEAFQKDGKVKACRKAKP